MLTDLGAGPGSRETHGNDVGQTPKSIKVFGIDSFNICRRGFDSLEKSYGKKVAERTRASTSAPTKMPARSGHNRRTKNSSKKSLCAALLTLIRFMVPPIVVDVGFSYCSSSERKRAVGASSFFGAPLGFSVFGPAFVRSIFGVRERIARKRFPEETILRYR